MKRKRKGQGEAQQAKHEEEGKERDLFFSQVFSGAISRLHEFRRRRSSFVYQEERRLGQGKKQSIHLGSARQHIFLRFLLQLQNEKRKREENGKEGNSEETRGTKNGHEKKSQSSLPRQISIRTDENASCPHTRRGTKFRNTKDRERKTGGAGRGRKKERKKERTSEKLEKCACVRSRRSKTFAV